MFAGPPYNQNRPDFAGVLVSRPRPWQLTWWVPLPTKAPGPHLVQPACCYVTTCIFYARPYRVSPHRRYLSWFGPTAERHANGNEKWERRARPEIKVSETGSFVEYDRVEWALTFDDHVRYAGEVFHVGGGGIRWGRSPGSYPRWWFVQHARRARADDRCVTCAREALERAA